MLRKSYFSLLIFLISLSLFNCSKVDDFDEKKSEINESAIFEVTLDTQILNKYNPTEILKILKTGDGYIIFINEQITTDDNVIRIIKINNEFSEQWNFSIDESKEYPERFAGVLELPNHEYIVILNTFKNYFGGIIRGEVYGLKFNNTGGFEWKKTYINKKNDYDNGFISHDYSLNFENDSNNLKFFILSDSIKNLTTIEQYYKELTIDENFNILNEENFPSSSGSDYMFGSTKYHLNGNKYTYGQTLDLDFIIGNNEYYSYQALILKYNPENKLIYKNIFGIPERNEIFHDILIDNDKIITIGEHGDKSGLYLHRRYITQLNESNGNLNWEIIADNPLFSGMYSSYIGRDITVDEDGNYLALFHESAVEGHSSTLVKINKQGKVLWTYLDSTKQNMITYNFFPYSIYTIKGEYLIFGLKEQNKIWVKKIKKS